MVFSNGDQGKVGASLSHGANAGYPQTQRASLQKVSQHAFFPPPFSLPWRYAPAAFASCGRSWASLAHSSLQNARISRFPARSMPLRTSSMPFPSRVWPSSTSFMLGRMRPALGRMHTTEQISRNCSGSARPTRENSRQKAPTAQILLHPTRLRRHRTRN